MTIDARTQQDGTPYRHILVLLFLGYLLSFADRIAFGLVLKPIQATLGLSDSQAGLLAGAAFAVSYAIFSPLGGYFVDRKKRRTIFVFAVAFWSAATFSCGLATSAIAMGISRAGVGAGEAFLHPLAVSLVGDTTPSESRAKAFAFYLSAGAFGTVGVLLFGGALLHVLNGMPPLDWPLVGQVQPWQSLFMLLALPGFVLAAVVLAKMKEPPRHRPAHDEEAPQQRSVWAFLRAEPALGAAFIFGFPLLQMAGYSFLSWLFVFFDRVHGWPVGKAGTIVAVTCGVTFVGGCLCSGQMVSMLRRRGYVDASLRACMLGGVAFACFGTLGMLMPTPGLALVPLVVAFTFGYLPTVGAYSAVSEVVPPTIRASLVGLNTLTVGLITNSLGPFLVGFLSEHAFTTPTGIRWAMSAVAVISAVGGTAVVSLGFKAFRRRMAEGVEA